MLSIYLALSFLTARSFTLLFYMIISIYFYLKHCEKHDQKIHQKVKYFKYYIAIWSWLTFKST